MIPFGAVPCEDGIQFTTWAPAAGGVTLLLEHEGKIRPHHPANGPRGTWHITISDAAVGDRYAYIVDGGRPLPDPASRFQPDGVHGWSAVVDPGAFAWSDSGWRGLDPRDAAIYELHVGTFAGAGRFADVAARLEYLRDLGVTVVELMPLADFPGSRNWGYDAVSLFAPSRAYGRPDDLRALVDRAHALGLAVVIDVVYNHLGPEGAYLPAFSPQFLTATHGDTPWGQAVNLDAEGSDVVRQWLIANARHWIEEYHADGLRLDATHALVDTSTTPFVAELVDSVRHATSRRVLIYAEDYRNLSLMVKTPDAGGWDLDGVWADDFHHVVRRMTAGDRHGYFVDYAGTTRELALTLSRGWLYVGQHSKHGHGPRGTDPSDVAMRKSVVCIQNHDQVGNRALGERLHHQIDPASWRAVVTLLLTAPTTPLLFMGQEWATSAPFQFFTDFSQEFGRDVVQGRRREFEDFPEFAAPGATERIPDPQTQAPFEASRLRWDEQADAAHAAVLALHRTLLDLRFRYRALRGSDACGCDARALDDDTVFFTRGDDDGGPTFAVCVRLRGAGAVAIGKGEVGDPVLTTEDPAFATDPKPVRIDRREGTIEFARPGAVVFVWRRGPE
jgi:maltooligosyltrehalose trehalohydrolase